jgi:hypothetical protein
MVAMHPMPMMTDAATEIMVRRDMIDLLSGDQIEMTGALCPHRGKHDPAKESV